LDSLITLPRRYRLGPPYGFHTHYPVGGPLRGHHLGTVAAMSNGTARAESTATSKMKARSMIDALTAEPRVLDL
jgi:hypothetical protein